VSGTDLDVTGGAQLAFTWIVVACFELLALVVVAASDMSFRAIRSALRRAV
jgi:hypothetical protein